PPQSPWASRGGRRHTVQRTGCSSHAPFLPGPNVPREGRARRSWPPGFSLPAMLRVLDAFLGNLHALDALEAEEQFDEIGRRSGSEPLDDCPERLLHVLAEGDALDREAAQVHLHALVRLKHTRAPANSIEPTRLGPTDKRCGRQGPGRSNGPAAA